MLLEQLDFHMQKNESRHRPYTLYKNKLKWVTDLNESMKRKLPEDNIGESLDDLGYDVTYYDRSNTKDLTYEKPTDTLEGIKIKNLCFAKDNGKGVKDKPQVSRNYLQKVLTHLIKDCCLKYTKKF